MNKILSILAIWLCSVAAFAQLNIEDDWGYPENPAVATSAITVAVNDATLGTAEVTTATTYGEGIYPEGVSVSLVATPIDGYHFEKWMVDGKVVSTDASCTFVIPDNDVTVTAVFAISQFKVTFLADGAVVKEEMLDFGSAIVAPETADKEGHSFQGWDAAVAATVPAHDLIYNAIFNVNHYDVTFNVEGVLYSTSNLEFGSPIVAPEFPIKTGYTFGGWTTDATVPAHDVTYDGSFVINKYNVIFNANNGTENIVMSLEYGSAITAPAEEPNKTGYSFNGWSPEVEGTTVPASDITFTANWNVNSYKVTFDVDGATTESTLDFGAPIVAPADPEKTGYSFAGWTPAVAKTMPAENVTYTATWVAKKYMVTFMADGKVVKSESLEYGSDITAPADPTKVGHNFLGWNPAVDATVPAHDVTYEASFGTGEYVVTFMVDGQVYKTMSMNYGDLIILPETDPSKEGNTFAGWENYVEGATTPGENVTYNAMWTVNKYKLTFNVDGVPTVTEVAYGSAVVAPEDPKKIGYSFDGWTPALATTMPANDLTYDATWVINKYNVTFEVDGKAYATGNYEFGTTIVAPETTPSKEGNTFAGWDNYVDGITVPANDIVFKALWTLNKYTVTFISEDEVVKSEELEYGTTIVLPAEPKKTGYDFTGWSPVVAETVPANDLTYKATFRIAHYKVSFVDGETVVKTETLEYGSSIVAPADPKKEGYTFAGWLGYADDAKVPANDVTYSALWTTNKYTVKFIDGETVVKSESLDFGSVIVAPETPEKEGHTFAGWLGYSDDAKVPANDVTYSSLWTVNKYTVLFVVGDEVIKSVSLDFGAEIVAPDAPEKEGYTFNGWSEIPATVPAHDVTVTGSFTKNPEPDAIIGTNADASVKVRKVMLNGKVVIIRGDEKYGLDGLKK